MREIVDSEQARVLSNHLLVVSGVYQQCIMLASVAQEFIGNDYNAQDTWNLASVLVELMLQYGQVEMHLLPLYNNGIKRVKVA